MKDFMKSVITGAVILGVVLMCSHSGAETNTVTMGVYKWEPYISEQAKNHGVLAEIAVAALEKMGYAVVMKPYPFARIMVHLKDGEIDLAPAISQTDERKMFLDFSSPIYDLEQGFTFKKGKIMYTTITDLKPYIGGIMRGTFWVKELGAAGIRYEEVTEQEQNIKKLVAERVDFVCMPKEIAGYLLKTLGEDPSQYEFGLFIIQGQPVGISQKTLFKELREDFEKGLTIIKSDGTYDEIISKYQ
jgi:polar amino acid transport system substrate-binding protein